MDDSKLEPLTIEGLAEALAPRELWMMDGYNDCIIGAVERCGMTPVLCYSMDKLVARHMADGMTREEAEEFITFNQLGAWLGEGTPCFLWTLAPGTEEKNV